MRVLPFFFMIFFLTSVLAVPVPSSDSENGEEGLPALSSDWRIEVVDSEGPVGTWTSLALDSKGNPHISYGNHKLKYARWTGSEWSVETVGESPFDTSIAVDSLDYPHISYHEKNTSDLKYARWNGTEWTIETMETPSGSPSLVLDNNDRPHLCYVSHLGWKYARWNGTEWTIEIVDSMQDVYGRPSLNLDRNGYPHITYCNAPGDRRHLIHASWNGSAWKNETVDDVCFYWTPSVLDAYDHPHIGYDFKGKLKYATWNGSAWKNETVDYGGDYVSIAVDSDNHPHISHKRSTSGLSYARWDGETWKTEMVEIGDGIGLWTSLALDGNDNPHLSYFDAHANLDLKYATKATSEPSRSVSLDIVPDTLNLKSKGRWITAYLGAENASVHDMDISSILLQDTLEPKRWDYQDDTLMLKFDRREFRNTVVVGESIEIKISGKWKDGESFEAHDYIRVINRGRG